MKTNRPTLDEYFMKVARTVATRSTCRHRDQGAVIVKDGRILSTGYNGAPPGQPHCIDLRRCIKEEGFRCRAEGLHGESNAIASAAKVGISVDGAAIYCVYSPCEACCNLLKSAGIVGVGYAEVYDSFPEGPMYLRQLSMKVIQIEES